RLEKSRLVSTEAPATNSLDVIANQQPISVNTPAELLARGVLVSSLAKAFLAPDEQTVILTGDNSKYGRQFASPAVDVKENSDYVFPLPVKIEAGRMRIAVIDSKEKVYASTIAETVEGQNGEQQPLNVILLPLVASRDESLRIVFNNEASNVIPIAQIG